MPAEGQRPAATPRVAVVGSGAAAMACAVALVDKGADVTVFDGGEQLEPERRATMARMAAVRPAQWSANDLGILRGNLKADSRGIPKKLAFGSDYPFRDPHGLMRVEYDRTDLLYSLAQGGLTTMWGGNIFPWRKSDFAGWPLQLAELEPHYKAVLGFMPLAAVEDDLAADYPLYHPRPGQLQTSRQGQELLSDLEHGRTSLRKAGITFGRARLAVRTARPGNELSGCIYCGQCLYGCPYGHIYSAADTLRELTARKAIQYRTGWYVEKFEDKGGSVLLQCKQAATQQREELAFDRVFIGAGVVPTARLVLHSLGAHETPVYLKDTQYFIVPFLRFKGTPGVRTEELYSLSQVVLEIDDPGLSRHGVQVQFYSYANIFEQVMTGMSPFLARRAPGLIDALLSRLLIIQGYLHSAESGELAVTLHRTGTDGTEALRISPKPNPNTKRILHTTMRKLLRHAKTLGGVVAWPKLEIAPIGKSYHCGGSFPMTSAPGALQTDRLGRPGGTGRVHIVDASVLPDVAETTLTFTAMANAHRIGCEAALLP